jgi:hypothetical protein
MEAYACLPVLAQSRNVTAPRGGDIPTFFRKAKKDFYPIDYRIYAPNQDGKTKNERFSEMVIDVVYAKKIKAKRILFDSWYASAKNLKLVHRLGLIFFTILKSNRMVIFSKESGWIHLTDIDWTPERLKNGVQSLSCLCDFRKYRRCLIHVFAVFISERVQHQFFFSADSHEIEQGEYKQVNKTRNPVL